MLKDCVKLLNCSSEFQRSALNCSKSPSSVETGGHKNVHHQTQHILTTSFSFLPYLFLIICVSQDLSLPCVCFPFFFSVFLSLSFWIFSISVPPPCQLLVEVVAIVLPVVHKFIFFLILTLQTRFLIPILQMKKPKFREIKNTHTVISRWGWIKSRHKSKLPSGMPVPLFLSGFPLPCDCNCFHLTNCHHKLRVSLSLCVYLHITIYLWNNHFCFLLSFKVRGFFSPSFASLPFLSETVTMKCVLKNFPCF